MNNKYYILDKDKKPIPATMLEWAYWMRDNSSKVVRTELNDNLVSTVFRGLNYKFVDDDKPEIFETMVFGPNDEEYAIIRTSTWEEAEAAHNAIVTQLKHDLKIDV